MFLRCKVRRKDGKQHCYWSVVENTRVAGERVVQRHVLYLGEINDTQELAWRRSIEVLEDGGARPRTVSLSRPAAGPQAGGLRSPDGTVAGPVQYQLRRAALRSDEHVFRGRSAVSGGRQAALWILARSPAGLCADHHRPGGDPRGSAAG